MEKIPIIRIVFKSMPDLIIEWEVYKQYGNLLAFCSEYSIKLKDIYKAKRELIDVKDFPTSAWEG